MLRLLEIKVETGIETFNLVHVVETVFVLATISQIRISNLYMTHLWLFSLTKIVRESGRTDAYWIHLLNL